MRRNIIPDIAGRYNQYFNTLEDAIFYCQSVGTPIHSHPLGYGYLVKYPRTRYTTRRSYADNFKWKGFDVADPDA